MTPFHTTARHRRARLLGGLMLLIMWIGLSACGHKGDLKLPEPEPTDKPASSTPF